MSSFPSVALSVSHVYLSAAFSCLFVRDSCQFVSRWTLDSSTINSSNHQPCFPSVPSGKSVVHHFALRSLAPLCGHSFPRVRRIPRFSPVQSLRCLRCLMLMNLAPTCSTRPNSRSAQRGSGKGMEFPNPLNSRISRHLRMKMADGFGKLLVVR